MREEELEVALKVVIVGNGGVGKSSMIQRYCNGTFTKDYKKTIGVDFLERQIEVDGEEVRLMLWDTAGQEEFDAITKAYYRGAQACVLAFSTTDRDSFEAAHSWKLKVENECGEIPTVIVQNKIDLMEQSVVNPEEADLLARALGCRLLRTSVKEDVNVAAVFRHLAARCLAELRDPRDCDYFTSPTAHHPNSLTINETKWDGREIYRCRLLGVPQLVPIDYFLMPQLKGNLSDVKDKRGLPLYNNMKLIKTRLKQDEAKTKITY